MEKIQTKIQVFLGQHKVVNLSYHDRNQPRACALWYASDSNLAIYYLSSLSTNHGTLLKDGGRVAYTIQRDDQDWRTITGIQGTGWVEMIDSDEAWEIYTTKFPFVKEQFSSIEQALKQTKLWKIQSDWIRLIDNNISFGHKDEMHLDKS